MAREDWQMLDCAGAMRLLDDYLSQQLRAEDLGSVHAHLETCERCFRRYRFEESVIVWLRRRAARACLPEGTRTRVLSTLAEAAPVRLGVLARLWWWWFLRRP